MSIYNWKDVERLSGVTEHRVKYAIARGRLAGFKMHNGAYVFTDEDVARIESYFSGRKPWQRGKHYNHSAEEGREK